MGAIRQQWTHIDQSYRCHLKTERKAERKNNTTHYKTNIMRDEHDDKLVQSEFAKGLAQTENKDDKHTDWQNKQKININQRNIALKQSVKIRRGRIKSKLFMVSSRRF